jgi:hypothetical protein
MKWLGIFGKPVTAVDEYEGPFEQVNKRAWYPFKPIPNVRRFEVRILGFDPVYALFNIRKRFAPAISFSKYSNLRHNRYMEFQLVRLDKARGNPELFFRISDSLINHSRVFFVRQLMDTYPLWHRVIPF